MVRAKIQINLANEQYRLVRKKTILIWTNPNNIGNYQKAIYRKPTNNILNEEDMDIINEEIDEAI